MGTSRQVPRLLVHASDIDALLASHSQIQLQMHAYSLRSSRILLAMLAVAVAACGGSGDSTTGPQSSSSPTVQALPSLQFTPNSVTIPVGGSVTFAFGAIAHNVFFDNAAQGAPSNIGDKSNASVTLTFNSAGTYVYNCHLHPGMQGTVVVH
jgi:plastocyanin